MSSAALPSASAPAPLARSTAHSKVLAVTGSISAASLLVAWPLALMALPQAGPWCRTEPCLAYPYESAEYRAIDFAWMYPALLGLVAFAVLLVLAEGRRSPRPTAARLARLAAEFGVALLAVDYALQLMVVQPSIIRGEQAGLSFWTQYNPHGGFIALENLGYLLLSLALVGVALMVPGTGVRRRVVRLAAGVLGGLGVVLLPVLAAVLGSRLEYLYEVSVISAVWVAIIVVAPMVGQVVTSTGGARTQDDG